MTLTGTSVLFKALKGHPDYPGTVKFSITRMYGKNGTWIDYLNVHGHSTAPVPGGNLAVYVGFAIDYIWRPFAVTIADHYDPGYY